MPHKKLPPAEPWNLYNSFTFGFRTPANFRKYPELIPIVCIIGYAVSIAMFSIYHALNTKGDVSLTPGRRPIYTDIKPTQCTKIFNFQPEIYRPIAELEALKNDLKLDEEEKTC